MSIALDPTLEQAMAEALVQTADGEFLAMDPNLAAQIVESAAEQVEYSIAAGGRPGCCARRECRRTCVSSAPAAGRLLTTRSAPGSG